MVKTLVATINDSKGYFSKTILVPKELRDSTFDHLIEYVFRNRDGEVNFSEEDLEFGKKQLSEYQRLAETKGITGFYQREYLDNKGRSVRFSENSLIRDAIIEESCLLVESNIVEIFLGNYQAG